MGYRRWSEAEIVKLRALVSMGLKRRDILAQFPGMPERRLACKMWSLGLRARQEPDITTLPGRRKVGLKIGCLTEDMSDESFRTLADMAIKHGVSVVQAIDLLVQGRAG